MLELLLALQQLHKLRHNYRVSVRLAATTSHFISLFTKHVLAFSWFFFWDHSLQWTFLWHYFVLSYTSNGGSLLSEFMPFSSVHRYLCSLHRCWQHRSNLCSKIYVANIGIYLGNVQMKRALVQQFCCYEVINLWMLKGQCMAVSHIVEKL